MGTAGYMAPEQLTGSEVDYRVDVFAIGVMVVEVRVGQRPFCGRTYSELLASISNDPVMLGGHGTERRRLESILRRATCADPAMRHASIAALASDLIPALRAVRRRFLTPRHRPHASREDLRRRERLAAVRHAGGANRPAARLSSYEPVAARHRRSRDRTYAATAPGCGLVPLIVLIAVTLLAAGGITLASPPCVNIPEVHGVAGADAELPAGGNRLARTRAS